VGPGWEKSLEVSIFFCGFTPPRLEPRTRLPLELPSRELPIGGGPATELRARIPDTSDAYGGPVRIQDLVSRSRNTETDATGARIRYVGVVLPEGFFDDCVRLPDGRRAVDVDSLFAGGAFIDFHAEALPAHRGSWRDVPIRVTATGLAYETLDFTYRLRDGRPQTHRLVPRERKRPLGLGDPASNDR
jgi:hypothetical protein